MAMQRSSFDRRSPRAVQGLFGDRSPFVALRTLLLVKLFVATRVRAFRGRHGVPTSCPTYLRRSTLWPPTDARTLVPSSSCCLRHISGDLVLIAPQPLHRRRLVGLTSWVGRRGRRRPRSFRWRQHRWPRRRRAFFVLACSSPTLGSCSSGPSSRL